MPAETVSGPMDGKCLGNLITGCSKDPEWPEEDWMEMAKNFRDVVDESEEYQLAKKLHSFADALVKDVMKDIEATECGICEGNEDCGFKDEKMIVATRMMSLGMIYGVALNKMVYSGETF